MKKIIFGLLLVPLLGLAQSKNQSMESQVTMKDSVLQLSNNKLSVSINLKTGNYSLTDKKEKLLVFENARFSVDNWNSPFIYGNNRIGKLKIRYEQKNVQSSDKKGKRLELYFTGGTKVIPEYRFALTLLDDNSVLEYQIGMKNTMAYDCRLMKAELFSNAKLFPNSEIASLKTLNGAAGVTMPEVLENVDRESTNSMMLTAVVNGKRQTLVWGGLKYQNYYANTIYKKDNTTINLLMNDPVGRLVKTNEEYWAPDTYYLAVGESNPFIALENYGLALRKANNAKPNVYDFPTLCGWAVGNLSGGKDINNSTALIEELDNANKCGLAKYTKIAVRVEPDSYCYTNGNTEQGWWDDEHWSKFGHLTAPYDTFAKWCAAVKERNGVPFTYFQASMPSDDFALAHPDWMLNNDISQLHLYHRHHQPYVRYDYTDKGFQKYVLAMWQRLRKDGMIGIKFDYPETAWNPQGGFDDKLATTTSAYRQLFQLAREGLGQEGRLHERALGESERPTLDVTAGIVDIQRTAWDTNAFESQYVTTGGLRWYKLRSVFYYYPDSKAIHIHNEAVRKSLVTMLALTSGRLELATPFSMLTPDMVHDISRTYPMYDGIRSPRPIDAFLGQKNPRVYDLELTPDWHALTLFNSGSDRDVISVSLNKSMVYGGLQLNPTTDFYVYDFWKNKFIGKVKGDSTLKSELNSMECTMYAIKKVEAVPQLLSTNRHILQGWMDVKELNWNKNNKTLSGKVTVVEGEPFKIVIATNNWKNVKISTDATSSKWENHPDSDSLKVLVLDNPTTKEVKWSVSFKK